MSRNFESYPGGHDRLETLEEKVSLPYSDDDLKTAVVDEEGTLALFKTSPELWLRSAIAVGSERNPSDISNRELVDRLINDGLSTWAPVLTEPVTDYLQDQGFFIFN